MDSKPIYCHKLPFILFAKRIRFVVLLSLILFASGKVAAQKKPATGGDDIDAMLKKAVQIKSDNESMSGILEWKVVLKDDNNKSDLPATFRNWWYVRLDGVKAGQNSRIRIEGDGFPGKSVVVPVWSFDKENWHRFSRDNIIETDGKDGLYNYTIEKQFDSSGTVWLARYYPYTYSKLINLLASIKTNPLLKITTIGNSLHGRPLFMLTITDPSISDKNKKRIWIHARTHPSETSSSYVVEGLIKFLLSDCNKACQKVDLKKLIFNIVPMVAVDGVAEGYARVSPDSSYDLERQWKRNPDDPMKLLNDVAPEVKAMHSSLTGLIGQGPEFILALNLHGKNAPMNWRNFIYSNFTTHFKKENKKSGPEADSLFFRTLSFARLISKEYCADTIQVRASEESERNIDNKNFPEMWWWVNFNNKVLALTLEATSGEHSCFEELSSPRDHLQLGEAIAMAIQRYYDIFYLGFWYKYNAPETDTDELLKYLSGSNNHK